MDSIEIQAFEEDIPDRKLILEAWLQFYACEAVCSAVPGFRTDQGRENLEQVLEGTLKGKNGPLLVAWDKEKQQAAGFLLVQLKYKNHDPTLPVPGGTPLFSVSWDEETTEQINNVVSFYTASNNRADMFNRFGVDKVWKLLLMSVCEGYARRGIAQRLTEKSLDLAVQQGFTVAWSNFSSLYTQKIADRCGFTTVIETPYTEGTYLNYNLMSREAVETHKACLVMAKRL